MTAPDPKVDYFSSQSLRQDLKKKAVGGGLVTAAAQAIRLALGLVIVIPVLSRLLEVDDFGLLQMVVVFTGFAAMFVNAGMSTATVQREEITQQQVSNLFWIATSMGFLVAAVAASLAPLIAWIYGEQQLFWITVVLAISFVFSGLTIQHQAMLRRGMQFKALAAANLIAFVVGQGAGIAWALIYRDQPHDYWALVIAPVATAMVMMLTTWILCRWRPNLPRRHAGTRELAVFGANLTMFSFVNYFARNADNLLIGLVWGKTPLGYYERAYKLLLLPLQQIGPSFSAVVVPALSRLQGNTSSYKQAYFAAVRSLSWASIPIIGLLACTAEPFILFYMGAKWGPVVPLLQALLPAAWANCFIISSGWAFTSSGRVGQLLIWGAVHSGILLIVMLACVPFGVLTVAWGVSIAYVVLRVPGFYYCFRGTSLRLRDLVAVLWHPTLAAGFAAGVAALVRYEWFEGAPPIKEFALTAGVYVLVILSYVGILPGARSELLHLKDLTRFSAPKPQDTL